MKDADNSSSGLVVRTDIRQRACRSSANAPQNFLYFDGVLFKRVALYILLVMDVGDIESMVPKH